MDIFQFRKENMINSSQFYKFTTICGCDSEGNSKLQQFISQNGNLTSFYMFTKTAQNKFMAFL